MEKSAELENSPEFWWTDDLKSLIMGQRNKSAFTLKGFAVTEKRAWQLEDLIADLIYLRKDIGFAPERIFSKTDVFLEVIGGRTQTYSAIKARLLSAFHALPDKQSAEALMAAFALLPGYEQITSLKARREKYGEQIGRKPDTLMDRENTALNDLAIHLMTDRYPRAPTKNKDKDGKYLPTPHGAVLNERAEITTVVRDKLWVETREYYRLIPLMDGIEAVDISSDIPARVTANKDSVVAKTSTTLNGLKHTFLFKEPLRRHEITDFAFTMLPNGAQDDELVLIEETRGFHVPTRYCSVEVMFLGEKPRQIWHYVQLPYFERPGKPTKQWLIDLKGGGSVRVEFFDLYGGFFSGVAWGW